MAVSKKTKTKIPAAMYAVVMFNNGEFYKVDQFGFNRQLAKAYAGGFASSPDELSAELIEVPLTPDQIAAIEAAIERAVEEEIGRAFASN